MPIAASYASLTIRELRHHGPHGQSASARRGLSVALLMAVQKLGTRLLPGTRPCQVEMVVVPCKLGLPNKCQSQWPNVEEYKKSNASHQIALILQTFKQSCKTWRRQVVPVGALCRSPEPGHHSSCEYVSRACPSSSPPKTKG